MNARDPLGQFPFTHTFARLPACFYTELAPTGLPSPYFIAGSPPVADLLGLPASIFNQPDFAECFAGNRPPLGSRPLAAVYSGHQFGVWAGQLGDGRAHLIGGIENEHGHWEIQLKGAGRTPYSRGADGRAVLRSSIREFLGAEAMAGLGIPTTRSLCLVGSDLPVRRETIETAAIVTRVAPSFIRFGSFEHWAAQGHPEPLRQLADYVIDTFRPACRDASQPYAALLADVARQTGDLIARWMSVGFMHGVMNTDNMSILGLTLDYGPFGFMDAFDAGHICNHSDTQGRYSYRNQPAIAQWNLYRLAEALLPLIGDVDVARDAVDAHFGPAFEARFETLMRQKLGFAGPDAGDEAFLNNTFAFLQTHHPDFTLFFRHLSRLPSQIDAPGTESPHPDAAVRDLFIDRAACDAWLHDWRNRLNRTPQADTLRQARMLAANPRFVLRNWLAEQAIRRARSGDFSEIDRLRDCLAHPFDEQAIYADYASPPPEWATHLEVSCSS